MTPSTADLTEGEYARLLNGRAARIHYHRAVLEAQWVPMAPPTNCGISENAMPKERRFVMSGPSGRHTLLVDATDRDRLNAHWRVFATDPRNAYPEPRSAK